MLKMTQGEYDLLRQELTADIMFDLERKYSLVLKRKRVNEVARDDFMLWILLHICNNTGADPNIVITPLVGDADIRISRQLLFYLTRKYGQEAFSMRDITTFSGAGSHNTVVTGIKKTIERLEKSRSFRIMVADIEDDMSKDFDNPHHKFFTMADVVPENVLDHQETDEQVNERLKNTYHEERHKDNGSEF